jgi:hypothetical protein
MVNAPAQPQVERDDAAVEQLRERHVLGVVGLGPAEVSGEAPRGGGQASCSALGDVELAVEEAVERLLGEGLGDLAAERELVEHRRDLAP